MSFLLTFVLQLRSIIIYWNCFKNKNNRLWFEYRSDHFKEKRCLQFLYMMLCNKKKKENSLKPTQYVVGISIWRSEVLFTVFQPIGRQPTVRGEFVTGPYTFPDWILWNIFVLLNAIAFVHIMKKRFLITRVLTSCDEIIPVYRK